MRELKPNDPGILISLARHNHSPEDKKSLLNILSNEGKLVAVALEFPIEVLKTAAGILERFPKKT